MKGEKSYNLFTFFSLYIAQAIPMSFFANALPVMMRQEDYSLFAIAMLKLIKFAWVIKFLWSPLVDNRTESVRDYKRWIIGSEFIYAIIILGVAFLNFEHNFALIICLIFFAFIASATQDIATDAMAARSFERRDSSLLNSMQTMGLYTGSMVGGGFLLWWLPNIGWGKLLPFVALFVLIALIPLYLNRKIKLRERETKKRAKAKDMYLFFCQKGIWKHIAFLFLFYSGLIGILSTLRPFMVDLNYSMKEIGIMVGIFGSFIGIVSSFLSGLLIRKIGKGASRKLISIVIVLVASYFLWMTTTGTYSQITMMIGITLLWGTYGMASTMVYTSSMDIVRDGREGTDFTMQIVITHFSSMIVALGCSRFGDLFGFRGLFSFELALAVISCIFVWFYQSKLSESKYGKGE